ncbi:MAG TPA: Holliday junction branch migration protein RuvA [Clostridiaceae bacterium]|nr:Holliday junction branch migration protein RuvA [Clostridiaceae bacterium]
MYSYIRGKIVAKTTENIIVEAGGIGYEIQIHPGMVNSLPPINEVGKIPVELSVREDQMSLFGFPGEKEKNLFRLVQSVSGIGPKLALTIAGTISPEAFALAVLNDDLDMLMTIRGIGKKGAQRMVLELKDKLRHLEPDMDAGDANLIVPAGEESIEMQTISALMVLGYRRDEARKALLACGRTDSDSLEDVIIKALKAMQI